MNESDIERLDDIYRSEEELKEVIFRMEARVVRQIRKLIRTSEPEEKLDIVSEIERELEWFLTWRLELAETPTPMWCDGVEGLSMAPNGFRSLQIEARAHIGPKSEASTNLRSLSGTLVLDKSAYRLVSYSLSISDESEQIVLTEAI